MRVSSSPDPIRLADYRPPAWRVLHAALVFDLDADATEVTATLRLAPDPAQPPQPLELDGEDLELLEIALDGQALPAQAWHYAGNRLRLPDVHAACELRTRVRIHPRRNTRLEGLYVSRDLLITQCEAEGFRRITFFPDRPDVMTPWRTTLRADAARYPVLLAGGNPVSTRTLDDGRHEAVWDNPHPTPAYLFAVAAGPMACVSRDLRTAEGRAVRLAVWAEPADVPRCRFALDATERALRWDEQRFGRCYDLDVFNVVAVQDFTMGAMENKGLNIFNARYILADAGTATDADFLAIESVVGHEYFHNWSGNRVTLRDWFQLSLKEGLTVFRDQEFSADLHAREVKRIEDVRLLRSRQFPEDAGPLAHAVRPSEYREINNFYTATVYEKGAEIVRMLHTLLGEAAFRAGMDRYFAQHDGRAATVEDFLAAHAGASGRDLSQFARWYAQPGTPELAIDTVFDAGAGRFTVTIEQRVPGQPDAAPLLVPLRYALYDAEGRALPCVPADAAQCLAPGVLRIDTARTQVVFEGLAAAPVPAFNQGFSAPVRLRVEQSPAQLALLARCETDGFNRWEAIQRLAHAAVAGDAAAREALCTALGVLLDDAAADSAFVAECLQLPDVETLAGGVEALDPEALWRAREDVLHAVAQTQAARLRARYDALADAAGDGLTAQAIAARALRNACLPLLTRLDPAAALASAQFASARVMSDALGALRCLLHADAPGAATALAQFQTRHAGDALVTDKWIALVAARPSDDALEGIAALLASPHWLPTNPNRVRALLGTLARGNPRAFHRADGAGYALLAAQIAQLDALNPQVAARLLSAFEVCPRLEPQRRAHMRAALDGLDGRLASTDGRDLLQRLRAAA